MYNNLQNPQNFSSSLKAFGCMSSLNIILDAIHIILETEMPFQTERMKILRKIDQLVNLEAQIYVMDADAVDDEIGGEPKETEQDELGELVLLKHVIQSKRYFMPRGHVPKMSCYFVGLLPQLDDRRYRAEMRMSREGFIEVLRRIENHAVFRNNSRFQQKPVDLQLAVALTRFGHHGSAASSSRVARLFGISEGAAELYTDRVITALTAVLPDIVKWPSPDQKVLTKRRFLAKYGFPNVVGLVDGTLIVLDLRPTMSGADYFTRKWNYALAAFVVCDDERKILYAYCGYPGSAHDSRVYSNSDIGAFPAKYFENDEYLLADSAYVPTNTVVPAFKPSSCINAENVDFNTYLAEARVANEHTIGILKGRFQSLKGLRINIRDARTHKKAVLWFMSCVVLHNILWGCKESVEEDWLVPEPEVLLLEGEDEEGLFGAMDAGKKKREKIKNFVVMARSAM